MKQIQPQDGLPFGRRRLGKRSARATPATGNIDQDIEVTANHLKDSTHPGVRAEVGLHVLTVASRAVVPAATRRRCLRIGPCHSRSGTSRRTLKTSALTSTARR